MLYEASRYGFHNHSYTGIAAIGSGSRMAQTYLLTLGQSKDSTLAETVFNVAMAKFASEKSEGQDVGPKTAMLMSWKAAEGEQYPCTKPLLEEEISNLRKIWEDEVKPRITYQGRIAAMSITQRLGGGVSAADVGKALRSKLSKQN